MSLAKESEGMLRSKRGLTLAEIILAVMVMTLAIVPIMNMAPAILGTTTDVEEMTDTTFLVTRKMEEARGRVMNSFDSFNQGLHERSSFPEPYNDYSYSVDIDANPDIKVILAEAWHNDSADRKVQLATKVARRNDVVMHDIRPVWNDRPGLDRYYLTLQFALDDPALVRTHEILAKAIELREDINATAAGAHLIGGWNDTFTARTAETTIIGSLTLTSGEYIIDYFIIDSP